MTEPGAFGRLRLAVVGAVAIAGVGVLVGAILGVLGARDHVERHGAVVTAVVTLYASVAVGFVSGRWRAVLLVWVAAVLVIVVEQLQWHDDPLRSGIDDLPPSYGLRFTPLVMLVPTIGVGLQRWMAWRREIAR
jgi:hypothetical protein